MNFGAAVPSLAVAVASGLLVGAERQQSATAADKKDFAGIRTFPMVSLLGALGALAKPAVGVWLMVSLLAGVVAFVTVSHVRTSARDSIGISTEVASLLSFCLGAVAGLRDLMPDSDRFLLVGTTTAAVLALLALKEPLHGFVNRLSADDVYATTKFVLLALVILPVLPRGTYGPLDVFSPYKIGKMIVLVAGVSFAGYAASRIIGSARGLLVAGLLGGLVSSTAVTLTYSGRGRKEPDIASLCAVAIIAACSTMFARLVVVVAIVDRPLLPSLAPPLGATALVGFAVAFLLYRKANAASEATSRSGAEPTLRNPFELKQAVSFGLLYGVVLFVAKAAQRGAGSAGLYVSSVLAGLTDVDAITLSVVDMHRGGLSSTTSATAIMLAALTNTVVKSSVALSVGGATVGRPVAATLGAGLAVGAIALALIS
ncbi:MAG: MgtC/SapB family protein [Polyangiales bacterium]